MKFVSSLISIAALTGCASAAKQTTVTILEFGKGGTIHAASNTINNAAAASLTTTPAAMTSFWKAMHPSKNGKYSSHGYAGMSVVPDLFTKADLGVIVALGGNVAEKLESMPTAMALVGATSAAEEQSMVGQVKIAGHVSNALVKGVVNTSNGKADAVVTDKNDFGRRLSSSSTADETGSLDAVSLQVMDGEDAKEADEQLRRLIQRLKDESEASDKTVVVHLVVETNVPESEVMSSSSRRRLQEDEEEGEGEENNEQQDGENNDENNNNQEDGGNSYTYAYNYKTMYEIQTFNVISWTAVGLVAVVFMVMGAFIGMPLYPDTLLFGFTSKIGSD